MKPAISNRFFIATMAVVAAAGLTLLTVQHRHLSSLRNDLVQKTRDASRQNIAVFDERPARSGKVRSVESDDRASEGGEYLAEAISLLKKIDPILSGKNYAASRKMLESDDYDRLRWIFSRMGRLTFQRLHEQHPDSPWPGLEGGTLLDHLFTEMNPGQALELSVLNSSDRTSQYKIRRAFSSWALMEPDAALGWYLANKDRVEALKHPEIARLVLPLQVKTRSADVVRQLIGMVPKSYPEPFDQLMDLSGICQKLDQTADRLAFFDALKAAAAEPATHDQAESIRQGAFRCLRQSLMSSPYLESFPVVDAVLTSQEKSEFAGQMVTFSIPSPQEWAQWAPWVAQVEAPLDSQHPLVRMANRGDSKYGEPTWLDRMQPGPLRDLAVKSYIHTKSASDPAQAARWLSRLPEGGELRREMAREVAESLQAANPDEAKALRTTERLDSASAPAN